MLVWKQIPDNILDILYSSMALVSFPDLNGTSFGDCVEVGDFEWRVRSSFCLSNLWIPGWWFVFFSHSVGNVMSSQLTNSIIFQRGRYTTNQSSFGRNNEQKQCNQWCSFNRFISIESGSITNHFQGLQTISGWKSFANHFLRIHFFFPSWFHCFFDGGFGHDCQAAAVPLLQWLRWKKPRLIYHDLELLAIYKAINSNNMDIYIMGTWWFWLRIN